MLSWTRVIGNMKPTRYNQQLAVAESRSGCPWQADSAGAIEIGLDESQTAFPQQGEKGRFFLLTSPLIGSTYDPTWIHRPWTHGKPAHAALTFIWLARS